MRWANCWARVWKLLRHRSEMDDELDAEVRAYYEMVMDRHLAAGRSIADARRAARLECEGIEQVKEQVRDVRVGLALESALQDVRYGWRGLAQRPGFTLIAVATLALGMGVNAAIFSVFYAALLRPLPYEKPAQLGLIWSTFEKSSTDRAPTSGPLLEEIKRRSHLFQDVAGIWVGNGTFAGQSEPEQVKLAQVTTNFLGILGVRPMLGRTFNPDETSGRPVIVLSYGLWKRHFGGDPQILGKAVPIEGVNATVVGVMPRDFQLRFAPDANIPLDVQAYVPFDRIDQRPLTLYFVRVLARLKAGMGASQAQADLDSVAAQIRGAYTEMAAEHLRMQFDPMQRDAVRDVRASLIALFAGASFLLLICSVNVANLMFVRSSERRREIAVRVSLGGSSGRILQQLLIEGLMLSCIAGLVGLGLGWIVVKVLLGIEPEYLLRLGDIGLSWPVVAWMAVLSMGAVLVFGLLPAMETIKDDVTKDLREAGRNVRGRISPQLRSALIAGEVALGLMLLIGAGLMIRTLIGIQRVEPGFVAEKRLSFELNFPYDRYPRGIDRIRFTKDFEARLRSIPGVQSVGGVSHLPLGDYPNWYSPFRPEGVTPTDATVLLADHRAVTPNYLGAIGTRLLEGRMFDERDRAGAALVVIVDELLARTIWPGQSALGKRVQVEHFTDNDFEPAWSVVVGVVEHVRNHSLSRRVRGEIYIPYEQSPREHLGYVVRSEGDPLALVGAIGKTLHSQDPGMALANVNPLGTSVKRAAGPASFIASLATVFALVALLLAAVGTHGVISYSVAQRKQEMGIRLALGANRRDVIGLVVREGLRSAGLGLGLGIAGAIVISRYLESLVFGVSTTDPATYAVSVLVVSLAAVAGCWRPAAKAASTNPLDAIRVE